MEPQNPSGPRPPSRPDEKSEPTSAWISPRLRDKLSDTDPQLPREKEGPPAWLGIVLLVIVLGGGVGLLLAMRAGGEKDKAAAAQRAEQAVADSIAQAKRDSIGMAARDSAKAANPDVAAASAGAAKAVGQTAAVVAKTLDAVATAAAKSVPPQKAATSGGEAVAAATPAAPAGPFGIDVASYLVEDRATGEQAKLATATGLSGRVVTDEDGSYHVVLGTFKSRAAAERAVEPLLAKGLVNEARVVPLKP